MSLRKTCGFAFAVGLCLPGCGIEPSIVPVACSGDKPCPPARSSPLWAVQLFPTQSGDKTGADPHYLLMPQEGQSLDFDGTGSCVLRFRQAVLLSGRVTTADLQPLPRARVQASLPSAFLGQDDYRFDTQTAEQEPGTYVLRVPISAQPSEQPYRLWVGFDDAVSAALFPPRWFDQHVLGDVETPVQMRAASQLAVLSGRIVNALGEGVGGMTVQVVDEDNRVVSSSAVSLSGTGSTGGTYRALVDPSLAPKSAAPLRVIVRPGQSQQQLPSIEKLLTPPTVGTEKTANFVLPAQRTPQWFMLPVSGVGPSGAAEEIKSARVVAQVRLDDATTAPDVFVYYTAQADTDVRGVAKLLLIPAPSAGNNWTYRVSIESPAGLPYASAMREVQVGPNGGVLSPISLTARTRLSGQLVTASGEAVEGSQVVAQPIVKSVAGQSPLERPPQILKPQTFTDNAGRFALWLDEADWDIDFIPVPGTAPRTSLDNLRVQKTDVDLGLVRLPALSLAKVTVISPTTQPAPQVKVRVLELADISARQGLSCVGDLPCSRTAKVRAEAFTDSRGRVQFLLPDSSPTASFLPR